MSVRPDSPYKGLNAFDDSELDALLFFGREREREIVTANLVASRLTVLYGPSGVGKSSLLRAAVARSLRALPEEPLVVVFSSWSDDPAAALAGDVVSLGNGSSSPSGHGLLDVLEDAQDGRDVYLVLDQAEEYFLYHADDAGPGSFAETLPALLSRPLRLNVLVSLREDSLAKLDRFTGRVPGIFANTLRLDRLDRQAATAAIVRPVERYAELTGETADVESALVARVLDDVGAGRIGAGLGGEGAVETGRDGARIEAPFLQLVMQRLWEEERAVGSRTLRVETLDRLGGAQQIVEEHLAGAMERLTGPQKDIASRLFNHLVTPSGTKISHEVSDLADFGEVSTDEVTPVLTSLADRRILRSLEEGSATRYEIFHDVLAEPVLAWRARHRTEREVEQQLQDALRRRARFQRILGVVLAAAALIVVVAIFAVIQRGNANEHARDARARQLDASAVTLLPADPELSLLLARDSARLSPGATAEDALRESLLASNVRAVYPAGGVVDRLAFSPNGRDLAFTSEDGLVRVRDVVTGRVVLARRVGRGSTVAFSSDGERLLVTGTAGAAQVLALTTGKPVCVLGSRTFLAADAQLAGRYAIVVRSGNAFFWDWTRCTLVHTNSGVGKAAVRVVVGRGGTRAAFISGRHATVVAVSTGHVLHRLTHPGAITSLAFSADGRRIVTGGRDQQARVWSGTTGRLLRTLTGHRGQVLAVAITPDGATVATASTDGTARIWDVTTGVVDAILPHSNFVTAVDFSDDGQSVVTASADRTARVWATQDGRPIATLAGHTDVVDAAEFSPNGFDVATAGEDGTVRLWDARTRQDLVASDLPAPPRPGRVVESPDGTARVTIDGKVVDLTRSNESRAVLAGHRLKVTSTAFAPDGKRLVTASRDHDAILWDVATGRKLLVLRGHFGSVADAQFSPDGRWIVTAGPRSVGLWKASTGELLRLLRGPAGPFTAVAFRPDSQTIVALSGGKVSSYRCEVCGPLSETVALADERLRATGRELTPEERSLYLG